MIKLNYLLNKLIIILIKQFYIKCYNLNFKKEVILNRLMNNYMNLKIKNNLIKNLILEKVNF